MNAETSWIPHWVINIIGLIITQWGIIRVEVHTLTSHCKHRPQKAQEVLDNLAGCPVPNTA